MFSNSNFLARIFFAIGLIFACAPAHAVICNDPSGFVKLHGTIVIGDTLQLGPDCQSAQDGGAPSGGGGQFIAGRVTLQTGVAVMQASQASATTVFFTPYGGNTVPISNGVSATPQNFTEVSQTTTDTTKSPAAVIASSCYDMFAWLDSATFRVTRGPAWTALAANRPVLTLFQGNLYNGANITNGPSASTGTYVGTICSNASATIDYIFGSSAAGGGTAKFGVWNVNTVAVDTIVTDTVTGIYNYTTTAWHPINGNPNWRVDFATGLSFQGMTVEYSAICQESVNGHGGNIAVGLNQTNTIAGGGVSTGTFSGLAAGTSGEFRQSAGKFTGYAPVGMNSIYALEFGDTGFACVTGNGTSSIAGLHFHGRM